MASQHRYRTIVAIVGSAMSLLLTGCGSTSSPGQPIYGPIGSQFGVTFPHAPKSAIDTATLLQTFPAGTMASAYWDSPDPQVLGNVPAHHLPTYIAIAARFTSVSAADTYMAQIGQVSGMRAITQGSMPGYAFVGPYVSASNRGSAIPGPTGVEGVLVVHRGATVFSIFAVTARASDGEHFLSTFKPA